MTELVRGILQEASLLPMPVTQLGDGDDLYDAGLSSFDLVTLIALIEARCGIEFPPEVMTRDHFRSIARIAAALESHRGEGRTP